MPRASKTAGRREKDLSDYEQYSDKLIGAILVHISLGGYVGVAHGYGYGLRLYVSYEDEKETFEYASPEHLDLCADELHEWRGEVLAARRAASANKRHGEGRGARSGARTRKDGQESF